MSLVHAWLDFWLWVFFIGAIARWIGKHHPPTLSARRRWPSPSAHCERTPDWHKANLPNLAKRQAN